MSSRRVCGGGARACSITSNVASLWQDCTSTRNLAARVQVFEQEGVTIGMAHGHLVMPQGDSNALEALRRRMAVDVLLTGSTGKAQTITTARGVLVNPGSITGAKASPLASGFASYTLLVLDNGKVR